MPVHINSIETYKGVLDRLPKSRAAVLRAIAERGPVTRNEVADLLNLPINRVTGRVCELRDAGLIVECGTMRTLDDRPRALLKAVPPEPIQGRLDL